MPSAEVPMGSNVFAEHPVGLTFESTQSLVPKASLSVIFPLLLN